MNINLAELFKQAIQHRNQHNCSAYPYESYDRLFDVVTQAQPDRILEIGSGCGFSTCVMMLAHSKSHLDTIEKDPDHVAVAAEFVRTYLPVEVASNINIIQGVAEQVLQELSSQYDLIFFDGYQIHYEFLPHYQRLLKSGGLLVLGNTHLTSKTSDQFFTELNNALVWQVIDRFAETIIAKKV